MTKKEWQPDDIKDFFSDFLDINSFDGIYHKSKDVYERMLARGYSAHESQMIAYGYQEALTELWAKQ